MAKISLRKRGSTDFASGEILYPITKWNYIEDKPATYPPTAHNHNDLYLGLTDKAANSDALDGHDSSYFSIEGHNHDDRYFTESEIDTKFAALLDSTPAALDTLNELAAALGDDPNFATTMTNALAGKLSTTAKAADSDKLDGLDSTRFQQLSESFIDNSAPIKSALGLFPSTAKTMIGNEYNILLNGHLNGRLTYTVTGSSGFSLTQLKNLTDGRLSPQYSPDGVDPSDPLVLLIEGLPATHTQTGGVIGWTARYWYPSKYKFEVYDSYQDKGWKTLIDQSVVAASTQNLIIPIYPNGFSGALTKIRITIYDTVGADGANGFNRVGLSELFFYHPEADRNYRYANVGFLDGHDSSYFSIEGHTHNDLYLGLTAKAADADKLDGHDSSYFAPSTVTIAAGTGLSGGGSLAANRTINLQAATSSELGGVKISVDGDALTIST